MNQTELHTLGIDIGSTTVKIAVLDSNNDVLFSDYERHFANIQETLSDLLGRAIYKLGQIKVSPMITGSGGLTLAKHLGVPFVQEVVAVSTALQDYAPQTDVAIELGGEDVIALGGDLDGADVPEYVADASKFPAFQQMLVERFGETITRKLCFENALSFFERV